MLATGEQRDGLGKHTRRRMHGRPKPHATVAAALAHMAWDVAEMLPLVEKRLGAMGRVPRCSPEDWLALYGDPARVWVEALSVPALVSDDEVPDLDAMDRHMTKSRRNRVLRLLPEVCELLRRLPRKGEVVFHTKDGRPWGNNARSQFAVIVRGAEIEHCSLHGLRRTFVSHLAMAGVNAAIVQKPAGHGSINTTVRRYTGIMPEALRSAQARFPFQSALADVSYPDRAAGTGSEKETAQVVSRSCAAG